MSDPTQTTPQPPTSQSLDDILSQLEKTVTPTSSSTDPSPVTTIPEQPISVPSPQPTPEPVSMPTARDMNQPLPVVAEDPAVKPLPVPEPQAPEPLVTPAAPPQSEVPVSPMVATEPEPLVVPVAPEPEVVPVSPMKPVEPAPEPPMTPPVVTPPAMEPVKSIGGSKTVLGLIGALILISTIGISLLALRANQDNRSLATLEASPTTLTADSKTTDATQLTSEAYTQPQPGTQTPRVNGYKKLPSSVLGVSTTMLSGLICPYEKQQVAGTLVFYNTKDGTVYTAKVNAGQTSYTLDVPSSTTLAFFYPSDTSLPPFAYTDYVRCGLDPKKCTSHEPLVMNLETDQEYGQVHICDPQVNYQGLPDELRL